MLIFPQLTTGASVQYPMTRQLSHRTVQSVMEDGTIVALADAAARYRRWRLEFRDLSDLEATALRNFFATTQGSLLPFVFLDPCANLLAWSEDFSHSVWQTAGLRFDTAVCDPFGSSRASRAHNSEPAPLSISQDSRIPGLSQSCFSVYLRTATEGMQVIASLTRSSGMYVQTVAAAVTQTWQRFYLSGSFAGVTDSTRYTITIPSGSSLEIFGPQVDAQVVPSQYVTSYAQSGIYSGARFDVKELGLTSTGPNRHRCTVAIRANLSLENNA